MKTLLGREPELELIGQAIAGAEGAPSLLWIEGEPGIGKTSLLERTAALAREAGFLVLHGRATEFESDRPFGPLIEALDVEGEGDLTSVAQLMAGAEREHTPFRLIDDFADRLEVRADAGPVLLAIDDAQWADVWSLRALGVIARTLAFAPVLIGLAARPTPRTTELEAVVGAAQRTTRISLPPLSATDAGRLATLELGAPPIDGLTDLIAGASGNPFFIHEIVEELATSGAVTIRGGRATLAEGADVRPVHARLIARVGSIAEPALSILKAAAVAGSAVPLAVLQEACEVGAVEAVAAVGELRGRALLIDQGDRLAFRHDLIREAVYGDIGPAVARSLHRRLAAVLARPGGDMLSAAVHAEHGAHGRDADAADWMRKAASDPMLDASTACRLLERAAELDPPGSDKDGAEAVISLAYLQMELGRVDKAIPNLERLQADATNPRTQLAVLQLLAAASSEIRDVDAYSAWVREAVAVLPRLSGDADIAVRNRCAHIVFWDGRGDEALAMIERSLADAEPDERGMIHFQLGAINLALDRPLAALPHLARATDRITEPSSRVAAMIYQGWALADADRLGDAERLLRSARAMSEELSFVMQTSNAFDELARTAYATGSWDDALALAETVDHLHATAGVYRAFPNEFTAWVAHHRGADPTMPDPDDVGGATLAALRLVDDDAAEAVARLEIALQQVVLAGPQRRRPYDFFADMVRVALRAGDRPLAERIRDAAADRRSRGDAPGAALAAARCRVLVDRDASAASDALSLIEGSPRVVLVAATCEDVATVVDSKLAGELRARAEAIWSSLGAARELTRFPAAASPARPRPKFGWESLTPAELDVVRLVAEGLTNKQVGTKLFVSHRTVATHLAHAFDKLGVRSRTALAAEVARRGGGLAGSAG